jgi:nitrogen fixation protein NifQ
MFANVMSKETIEEIYEWLMAGRRGDALEDILARILASWFLDYGVLPDHLGLTAEEFSNMLRHHFPGINPAGLSRPTRLADPQRFAEMEDLHKLLMENRSGSSQSEAWMADIVVAGCMGSDHLWQDLGLWSRQDLSRLMLENFEPLAKRNSKDMKWKKFLYKQLCEAEGIYTCRAPSCEVCIDYRECFGPEE